MNNLTWEGNKVISPSPRGSLKGAQQLWMSGLDGLKSSPTPLPISCIALERLGTPS